MAKKRKVEEEEIDDIMEELDELEDEDEIEEEPDERPTKRARSGGKKAKAPSEGIGTNEVAEAAGITPRYLRMLLRKEFPRDEGGRYQWKSLNDPEVKRILKRVKQGGASEAAKESLENLKSKKKKSSKKSSKKKARG